MNVSEGFDLRRQGRRNRSRLSPFLKAKSLQRRRHQKTSRGPEGFVMNDCLPFFTGGLTWCLGDLRSCYPIYHFLCLRGTNPISPQEVRQRKSCLKEDLLNRTFNNFDSQTASFIRLVRSVFSCCYFLQSLWRYLFQDQPSQAFLVNMGLWCLISHEALQVAHCSWLEILYRNNPSASDHQDDEFHF